MKKIILVFCLLFFSFPFISVAEQKYDDFFTKFNAEKSIENLSQDSSNYTILAGKIMRHPKYKRSEQLPREFELYIRITGSEINSFETIGSENLYMRPAYDRLYLNRYIEYMEYKNKLLELELAKAKHLPKTEIDKINTEFETLNKRINSYFDENMWPD